MSSSTESPLPAASPAVRGARLLARHPWRVIACWTMLAVAASRWAPQVARVLSGQGGTLAATEAQHVERLLRTRFVRHAADVFVVTVSGPAGLTSAAGDALVERMEARLLAETWVEGVRSFRSSGDSLLLSRDGRAGFLLVGVSVPSADSAVRLVTRAREVVSLGRRDAGAASAGFEVSVTGEYAFDRDTREVSADDGRRFELRLLPVTFSILVLAFGALVAALLPVLVGVLAIWLAFAVITLVGTAMPLSVFVLNLTTMVGLGVGIDYALLFVTRYRQERRGAPPEAALARTLATAGEAILSSGLIVLVGFGALLATPLLETRSVGVGGVVIVAVAMLLSLTLLPALVLVLGHRIDWPAPLAGLLGRWPAQRLWAAWARGVARWPVPALALGLGLVGAIAWPATRLRIGLPARHWWPAGTESAAGAAVLRRIGVANLAQPVRVTVEVPRGEDAVSARRLRGFRRLSDRFRALPGVASVRSPVDLAPGTSLLEYSLLYGDLAEARRRHSDGVDRYVGSDGRVVLLEVTAADSSSLLSLMQLAGDVRRAVAVPTRGLEDAQVSVGGFAAEARDVQGMLLGRFPLLVGSILSVTFVMLALAFRSLLVPLKAVVLNALSVTAAFGALVFVFQEGHGAAWFGLEGPMGAVHAAIPVLVFAVVFGLSMDYEVFLLSRVREAYLRSGDNALAVSEGLRESAATISAAALIMVLVFGVFAFARVAAVQLLGFGLATAILLDATLIRMLLAPALMHLAGRWNWWPSRTARRARAG